MSGVKVKKNLTFKAPIESVYKAITDYKQYPEFVEGCSGVKILEEKEGSVTIEYSINVIKN